MNMYRIRDGESYRFKIYIAHTNSWGDVRPLANGIIYPVHRASYTVRIY